MGWGRMLLCENSYAFSLKALQSFVIQIIPREKTVKQSEGKMEEEIVANLYLVGSDL